MKKRILYSLILFVILIFILSIKSFATSDSFSNLSIDIKIDDDGTAYVSEEWEIEVYSGTELYKSYYDLEDSEIRNLVVSEDNEEFTTLSKWDTSLSLEDKKEKCGINNVTDGVEICFGIGEYGKHTYKISYEITNFVYEENGSELTYFTLVPTNMDPVPENVNIVVRANEEFTNSNVSVSARGTKNTTSIDDGVITLKATSLKSSEYVALKLEYTDLFDIQNSSSQTNNKNQSGKSLEKEESEEISTDNSKDTTETKKDSMFNKVVVVILVLIAFLIVSYVITSMKRKKEEDNNL
jgi:hypothetical protein